MANEPTNVRAVIRKIFKLEERMRQDALEVKRLERLLSVDKKEKPQKEKPVQTKIFEQKEVTPVSDLRDAIMTVFVESKAPVMKIDDVLHAINDKYHFAPDKITLTNRLNYLADRQHKLVRGAKRGRYQLPSAIRALETTGG